MAGFRLASAVLAICLTGFPAAAQVCIFPNTFEGCEFDGCEMDFASTSDTGVGATSSVDLGARRARAESDNGAGQRAATAFIGLRITPQTTTEADFRITGTYNGLLQGGFAPTSFGRVRIWGGLQNLTAGSVDVEEELVEITVTSANPTPIPQNPLDNFLSHEFSATLEEGNEYAVYFRVEARSRGLTSQSDFRTGDRGVFFETLTISPTTMLPDGDGDGLFDVWETEVTEGGGVRDCNDAVVLDLAALGADPDHKDIFVEYDWLPGRAPAASTVAEVKAAFAAAPSDAGGVENPDGMEGINLWVDTGNATTGDDLDGGGVIDLDDVPNGVSVSKLGGDFDNNGIADFYDVKAQYFDPDRRFAFHYVIGGPNGTEEQDAPAGSCSDGVDNDGDGLVDGDDVANCFRNSQGEGVGNDFFLNVPGSGIFMHELGHNLGLDHGGFEERNCKPNYVSVMNYNMQNGIPQDTIVGQDTDADGVPDNRIIDYSPPRFPGGRGIAPLATLDENGADGLNGNGLDETVILDPSDPENMTVFIDAMGATQTSALDAPIDWNGDGVPDDTGVTANVNSGPASGCSGDPLDEDPHVGQDDWSSIVMNFRQAGDPMDGAINATEEPEPTPEELEDLLEAIYTTDLAVTKTVDPNPWVAGQEVVITIAVTNLGPNHTQQVRVTDALPDALSLVDLPSACATDGAGVVTCDLGRLRESDTAEVSLRARIARDLQCLEGQQFAFISNTAVVENGAGDDPNSRNDSSTVRMQALCVNYEYAAKLICGSQEDPDTLRLMRGRYGTTVNVHNPNDTEAVFFKKLALAFPPAEQEPGAVIPLALDRLRYDESLKSDCDELRRQRFGGVFPEGYIEGHLVVQSALSLDVQGVYTAAPLTAAGESGGVATIDVEYVPERSVRLEAERLPDLIIDEAIDLSVSCAGTSTSRLCQFSVAFGVRNIGEAVAGPFQVRVVSEPGFLTTVDIDEELAPGEVANRSVNGQVAAPTNAEREVCLGADEPANAVEETDETNNDRCLPF